MSLYLCIFDGDREVDGLEVGAYADFNALRAEIAREAGWEKAVRAYPTLLGHSDCDGAWSPADCILLRSELAALGTALRAAPPIPYAPGWQAEAARSAGLRPTSAYECFVDVDGALLLDRLSDLAEASIALNLPILFQ
jgi:hypothetical protein